MPEYYLSVPDATPLPADGGKIDLGGGVELHRHDGAEPDTLAVAAGDYQLFAAALYGSAVTVTTPGAIAAVAYPWRERDGAGTGNQTFAEFTLDLSGGNAGDVFVGYIVAENVPTILVNGSATGVTILGNNDVAGFNNTGTYFEYVLTGSETASTVIRGEDAIAIGRWMMAGWHLAGVTRDDHGAAGTQTNDAMSDTLTVSDADNVVVALAFGEGGVLDGSEIWTGLTGQNADGALYGGNHSGSLALASNVAAGSYSVSLELDAQGADAAVAFLSYSAV